MRIFKLIIGLLSVICLVGLSITQNSLFAVGLLAFSSMRIGIMIGEKGKVENHGIHKS